MQMQNKDAVIMTISNRDNREEQSETGRSNDEDYNYQYYEQYKKLYLTSYYLSTQMKELLKSKDRLWSKVVKFQKQTEEEFKDQIRGETPEKKKRFRRTTDQIQKRYECGVQRCHRTYGTEGSLQQHIKLKHPELYNEKTDKKKQLSHLDE